MIKGYVKDSILDATQKYIAHGVNCQNKMGSGVAKVIYMKYPLVKRQYHIFMDEMSDDVMNWTPKHFLGEYNIVKARGSQDKHIINCWTQEHYGYCGSRFISYDAIYDVFSDLAESIGNNGEAIAIPKIGCGLAGGNWEIVSRIIDDATGDDLDVYVYEL